MKPVFGSSLIRWQPTRGHLVAVLSVGFVALGIYLENRDRLFMHLAIGIGMGLGIAALIVVFAFSSFSIDLAPGLR
jgi:hypothetical protein